MTKKRLWNSENKFIKRFIFVAVFLFMGLFSIAAQDLIILRDGNMIEAKVSEISPTEIRYKRFDNLDGPTIVIPADRVLSIRYQNGTQEIINADTKPVQKQTEPTTTALNPDKFIFSFSANPGGILLFASPALCLEFGKGGFNSEVNLLFPIIGGGFGALATFNWFKHNSVGGFYLGGGIGYIFRPDMLPKYIEDYKYIDGVRYYDGGHNEYYDAHILTVGLNIGWKFVTRSGVYFRTGSYIGVATYYMLYLKPDLAIGYCFK